jgi:hypothetical protein
VLLLVATQRPRKKGKREDVKAERERDSKRGQNFQGPTYLSLPPEKVEGMDGWMDGDG